MSPYWRWFLGAGIALAFAAWAMRSPGVYNVVDTDAARHAMNGVFLRDLIAHGDLRDVTGFARNYYAHLPALSMPYHPPLFPMMEALFYTVFGVSTFAARLAVAVSVAIASFTLFALVCATHRSTAIAAFSTVTFLCLPESLWLGSDVMLEFPALAVTLLAIYCLHSLRSEDRTGRALWFGTLAGAAVWTKQTAVFLGAVPFLYVALLGRWKVLRSRGIWLSTAVFMAAVLVLTRVSVRVDGAGFNQVIHKARVPLYMAYYLFMRRNASFYSTHYSAAVGPAGIILLCAAVLALIGALSRRLKTGGLSKGPLEAFWDASKLYLAWIAASLGLLSIMLPYATRYLFLTYPALIVLGYSAVFGLAELIPRGRRVALAIGAAVMILAAVQFPLQARFLYGPERVAEVLAPVHARRILYCGGTDGNFILNYRIVHPNLDTTVIAGDKLPKEIFSPKAFEVFARDYGVQYIVIEDAPGVSPPWRQLMDAGLPTIVFEREFSLSSSSRWNGTLRIYRFTDPSANPKNKLTMRMSMLGGTMDFQLGK